jgi:hypothetical protein
LAICAGRRDFAVCCNHDRIERRRQCHDQRCARARQRPNAYRGIVSGANQRFAICRKRDTVSVLLVSFKHGRRATGKRPQANRSIPRRRGEGATVGRHGERGDRSVVSLQDCVRRRIARRPDADLGIRAGGHRAAILEKRDGVYRALVQPQNLLGDLAAKRPADCRCVKTPGERHRAIGGNRKRADRPAMAAQLREGCRATGHCLCR